MKRILAWILALMMMCAGLGEEQPDATAFAAAETLKSYWAQAYAEEGGIQEGVLQIKNARIVRIRQDLGEDEAARKYFGEVSCVVEFMIYCDLGAGAYLMNPGAFDAVVVRRDGTMEAVEHTPFEEYRAHTYSLDFSGIIEEIEDCEDALNGTFELLQ